MHKETGEPLAKVAVVDGMGDQLGDGVEKKKDIVVGDLCRVPIKQLLIYIFVHGNKVVEECYFDDFFQDAPKLDA